MPNYYAIEKHIPISQIHRSGGKWSKMASKMMPGDSVLLKTRLEANSLITALKVRGYTGIQRYIKAEDGIRVWCIEHNKAQNGKK